MQFATPRAVRGILNQTLTGPSPAAAMKTLLQTDILEPFGVSAALDPTPLDRVPDGLLCRWWAFLHLTGQGPMHAGGVYELGGSFLTDLVRMQTLYQNGPAETVQQLKDQLVSGFPFDYADAAQTFAVMDRRFENQPNLYRKLCFEGQNDPMERLGITGAELLTEGVPACKVGRIMDALLRAVVHRPELNQYPTLAGMAREMARFL